MGSLIPRWCSTATGDLPSSSSLFDALDLNHDGIIDRSELDAALCAESPSAALEAARLFWDGTLPAAGSAQELEPGQELEPASNAGQRGHGGGLVCGITAFEQFERDEEEEVRVRGAYSCC